MPKVRDEADEDARDRLDMWLVHQVKRGGELVSSEGKRLTLYLDKQVAELQAEVERLREAIKYELRTEAHTGWRRRLEAVLALHSDEDAI